MISQIKKWFNKCRSCNVDGIHKSLIDRFKNLEATSRVKTVDEYRCSKCGTLWVLADKADFVSKVVRKGLYEEWKAGSCAPTPSQAEILNQIVGAPDYYRKDVYFPCKIRLQDGRLIPRALLMATTGDCFGKFPIDRDVIILDGSHEILPSEYALPPAVRAATMVAPEKSMGYAPVNVKDGRGNRYTLASQSHFFEKDGILGPDITLDDSPYHGTNIVRPGPADMHLICDMFE